MVVIPTITSRNQTIEKVVKRKTYVYGRIPYYNPKIGNTSYHYRYFGRKDDDRIRKIRSILRKKEPDTWIIHSNNEYRQGHGHENMPRKHITETESKEIIAVAVSKIIRPLPLT